MASPLSAAAQTTGAWNEARAVDLVERGRAARQATAVDSAFRSYEADARGFVYFFLDRPDSDERTLVKADQIALQMFWKAPDMAKQRIIGLRDEKVLPTNIRYHLDHLTVVQDEFGDLIRLGDGDEVSAVVHPLAPGAEDVYDYRLADSLTISFPGLDREAVRVYEVQVRPVHTDRPGFVGSVFLDRGTAAIVRMSFTFTPASYVDPYLDYIRISLDNSLWMGRYWLPYRQEAELRRELPQLDFLAGSVIRGRFEIGGYEINKPLPDALFRLRGVTAVPEAQREAFPFEEPLFSQLDQEGLATPPSLEEIRAEAREMMADRYLSGLARLRLHVPSASSLYRYDRAEGHFVGAGATFRPKEGLSLKARAGWAFGRERASGAVTLSGPSLGGLTVEGYVDDLRDIGPFPASAGLVNSLEALISEDDHIDPWFATGGRLAVRSPSGLDLPLVSRFLGPARIELELRAERHESAGLEVDGDGFRPVLPVEEGTLASLRMGFAFGGGAAPTEGFGLHVSGTTFRFADETHLETRVTAAWARTGTWRDTDASLRLDAGSLSSGAPPQRLYLLGGRGTLLGHPFRGAVGDRFWLARAEAGRRVLDPWLSVRGFASAGEARMPADAVPTGWTGVDPDAGTLVSVGAGVGLLWDVLWLDLGRGLSGGEWELAFSVARRFDGWL